LRAAVPAEQDGTPYGAFAGHRGLGSAAAALPPVSSGAAVAYRTLFMTIKQLAVGRTLNVRLDSGEMTLTVTEFDSRLDVRRLAVGQLNDVRLAAADIRWDQRSFSQATLVLHNVHLRPGVPPVLVATPIEVTLEMSSSALDDVFRSAFPRLTGHVDDDGVARLRLSRRPELGALEVDVEVDGSMLWLHPRVILEGIAWRFRTGSPWRDLPADFGPWQTVWKRHHRWSLDGTYDQMFGRVAAMFGLDEQMADDIESLLSVDSTSVRAHQHSAGARSDTLATGGTIELHESRR
jgi:transposase